MSRLRLGLTAFSIMSLLLVGGMAGTSLATPLITRVGATRVAVRAEEAPMGALLRELDALKPLNHVRIDPGLRSRRVSVRLEGIPVEDALIETLRASGLDFMIWGDELWIGDLSKAVPYREVAEATPALAARSRRKPPAERGRPSESQIPTRAAAGPAFEGDVPLDESGLPIAPQVTPPDPPAAAPRQPPGTQATPEMRDTYSRLSASERQAALAQFQGRPVPRDAAGPDPAAIGPEQASEPYVTPDFTMVGENVTYTDPNFVPYKNRPEVRARRLGMDVSTIP
jgi:hypothetical protein